MIQPRSVITRSVVWGNVDGGDRFYRWLMLRRFFMRWRANDWHVELVIALVVAALGAAGALVDDPGDAGESGRWPAAVAGAAGLALAVRRVAPIGVLGAVLSLMAVVSLQGHQVGTTPVALLFAGHAAGRWAEEIRAWTGLAGIWIVFAVLAISGDAYFSQPIAALAPVIYALPLVLGRYLARRADAADEEREVARLAERGRIARDLHDTVTHGLTGISVQAAAARHLGTGDEGAAEAFSRIELMSRESLADLRRMLVLLRDDVFAPVAPSPGISDVSELVQVHATVHGPVELLVEGSLDNVEPSVGLAAYRIVQEALTNVVRHAQSAPAVVRLGRAEDGRGLTVTVDNVGGGTPNSGTHAFGLVGMRERVAVFGGTVEAHTRPEGGFRVHARIPGRR